MNTVKVCSRCIMDETAKEITFDNNGVCNFCHNYDNVLVNDVHTGKGGEEKLEKLIEKIKLKGKNSRYDVLIGLSGGVDSSYVAYVIKKKYGLRAFAVHLDNGWNSELAVSNIEKTLDKLGIDLFTYVIDWDEFKDIHLIFNLMNPGDI